MDASPTPEREERRIYRISEINQLSKMTLESSFREIWVEGEISNLKRPQSGHLYFTLKDSAAQIRAVLFRSGRQDMKFDLADGIKVRARGTISIYAPSGSYQIICSRLKEAGKGSLYEQFEKLKKRLGDEGLFEADKKQPLPLLPRHIGVVTSATGAAVRDILNVARRRFPNLHILIAPVMVQGEDAPRQIAHAIDYLNRRGGLDVMIVGRGGGSIEDLWAFNDEMVARAIARSRIPVISGVGHETDFTISDFVADRRAPTPSAAAEILVGQKEDFERSLRQSRIRIENALKRQCLQLRNRFDSAAGSYVFREPANLLGMHRQRLEGLLERMSHRAADSVRNCQQRIDESGMRGRHALERRIENSHATLDRLRSQLSALDPARVLKRGYSITRDAEGRVVRSVSQVALNQVLKSRLADGAVISEVMDIEEEKSI